MEQNGKYVSYPFIQCENEKKDLIHVWLNGLGRGTWVRTTEISLILVCLSRREAHLIIEATALQSALWHRKAISSWKYEGVRGCMNTSARRICVDMYFIDYDLSDMPKKRDIHKGCFLFYRQGNRRSSGFAGKAEDITLHTKWTGFVKKCTYLIWKRSAPVNWYYNGDYILLINTKLFS